MMQAFASEWGRRYEVIDSHLTDVPPSRRDRRPREQELDPDVSARPSDVTRSRRDDPVRRGLRADRVRDAQRLRRVAVPRRRRGPRPGRYDDRLARRPRGRGVSAVVAEADAGDGDGRTAVSCCPDDLLAIVCASHDGSAMHTAAVLAGARHGRTRRVGPAQHPVVPARGGGQDRCVLRRATGRRRCSRTARASTPACSPRAASTAGRSTTTSSLDHPLQVAITASIEQHGAPVDHVGIDGCGAPTHAIGLADLARAFAAIARSQSHVADVDDRSPRSGRRARPGRHALDAGDARARDEGRRRRRDGRGVARRPGVRPEGRERCRRRPAGGDRRRRCACSASTSTTLGGRSADASDRVLGHGARGRADRGAAVATMEFLTLDPATFTYGAAQESPRSCAG